MARKRRDGAPGREKTPKEVLEHWQPPQPRTVRLQGDPPSGQLQPAALEFWHHKNGWEEHFPAGWFDWLPLDKNWTAVAHAQSEVFLYEAFPRNRVPVLDVEPVDFPGPFAIAGNWMFRMLRLSNTRWLLSAPNGAPPAGAPWMSLSLLDRSRTLDRLDWPQRSAGAAMYPQPCNFGRMFLACDGRILVAREQDDLYVVGIYGDRLRLVAHDTMPSRGLLWGNGVNVWVGREVGLATYQWWQLTDLQGLWGANR